MSISRDGATIRLAGPLTMVTVSGLLRQSEAFYAQAGAWELDLAGVDEVDSAALGLLLEWARQAARRGAPLRLSHLSDNLRSLLKVYGLQDVLPVA